MRFYEIFREMEELQKRMTRDMFKGFGSFDETFRGFGSFENMFSGFDSLRKKVEAGELEGDWSFEPIERPGVKGFIARGFFSTPGLIERPPLDRPADILLPLKPSIREPREYPASERGTHTGHSRRTQKAENGEENLLSDDGVG